MKRKGLSWDGGKKRIVAVAMMLSVLAAPGVAHADTADAGTTGDDSVAALTVEVAPPSVRMRAFFGVSWG